MTRFTTVSRIKIANYIKVSNSIIIYNKFSQVLQLSEYITDYIGNGNRPLLLILYPTWNGKLECEIKISISIEQ